MKFDIIDALDIAQHKFPDHMCNVTCSKSQDGYLVQIKVLVDPNQVYGQQIAFSKAKVINDDWWYINEEFAKAIASLGKQINK